MQNRDLDSQGQASAVEVTPEMVEAGLTHLALYDRGWDDPRDLLVKIFRSMLCSQAAGQA